MTRLRTSRPWLATRGRAPQRSIAISFSLSRRAPVLVRVDQVAPTCRFRGTFLVRGRAGRNVFRFRGRVRGRMLPPGTYRLTVYPRGLRGRRLESVTVVILRRGADAAIVARPRNTCAATGSWADMAGGLGGGDLLGGVAGARARLEPRRTDDGWFAPNEVGAALGTMATTARAVSPALLALAGLAVLLLSFAAMPQPIRASRAGATLVHHRGTLAVTGVAVLITSLLAFLLL